MMTRPRARERAQDEALVAMLEMLEEVVIAVANGNTLDPETAQMFAERCELHRRRVLRLTDG